MSNPEPLSLWGELEILPLEKAADAKRRTTPDGEEAKFAGYVGGWMSLGTKDREGDSIDPSGIDVSMLLQDGWFNDNHPNRNHKDRETVAIYGYPVVAELRKHEKFGKAWWTEGPILDTKAGRELMDLARALKGTDRALGFSVEGPPPLRDPDDPHRIEKAWVWNVAITNRPVHEAARIELVKSMDAGLSQAVSLFCANHPEQGRALWAALTAPLSKGMEATAPVPNTATNGAALQHESVDGAAIPATPKPRKRKRKLIGLDEATAMVQAKFPHLSPEAVKGFLKGCKSIRSK